MLKKILITRVVPSSYKPNKRGFHIFTENAKIYLKPPNKESYTGGWSGLVFISWDKAPISFAIMEIEDTLYRILVQKNPTGYVILKQLIIDKYGQPKNTADKAV